MAGFWTVKLAPYGYTKLSDLWEGGRGGREGGEGGREGGRVGGSCTIKLQE